MNNLTIQFPAVILSTGQNVLKGIAESAAFARLGEGTVTTQNPTSGFLTTIFSDTQLEYCRGRFGQTCSRFALASMFSHFELGCSELLVYRRIFERFQNIDGLLNGPEMWKLRKSAIEDVKRLPLEKVVVGQVLTKPSEHILTLSVCLEGLRRIRNCIMHHAGRVTVDDIAYRRSIHEVKNTDKLEVQWLTATLIVGGKEVEKFPFQVKDYLDEEGKLQMSVELNYTWDKSTREWGLGEEIVINEQECQNIGLTLSDLTQSVINECLPEYQGIINNRKQRVK